MKKVKILQFVNFDVDSSATYDRYFRKFKNTCITLEFF